MYSPERADTSAIVLTEELQNAIEEVSKNIHEVWAAGRKAEGWTYGPERNDELKQTPCMVSYEDLPEFEKDYDRRTVTQTVKMLIKLGYKIEKTAGSKEEQVSGR